ncbi:MAG: inorganic diphosphatase [Planctomycetes bacterium]|nr:inorganic diphosphatase [Planctomycetota bacterium]
MHPWHDVDPGPDAPATVRVVVEIPKGSRNKYEVDKESGLFRLDRVLYSPMHYPGDYGFVPKTFYDDGDAFDVLIVTNEPTFVGCLVDARPVGLFRMRDRGEPDDKALAVPAKDPTFAGVHDLQDLPPHLLREIEHFFRVYKDLEGAKVETIAWEPAAFARERIAASMRRYREAGLGRASGA